MSDPLIKIFNQLYVGFQPRTRITDRPESGDWTTTPIKLAFVTPYENNAAGLKRKETVDRWAKPSGSWVRKEDGGQEYITKPKEPEFESVIIENLPTAGYKLAEEIRRTYWGGGNVVWRIESPLGWEFEISSSNLARIITDCGIAAGGEILGRCIFGRMGKDNILIPEGSELWEKSVKDAETLDARSKTVSATEVVPGAICTMKNGDKMTYMGKFHVTALVANEPEGGIRNNRSYYASVISELQLNFAQRQNFSTPVTVYHVFKSNAATDHTYGKTKFIMYKEKKVISVESIDPNYADQKKNEGLLNRYDANVHYASSSRYSYGSSAFAFSIDKPVSNRCELVPLDEDEVKDLIHPGIYSWPTLSTAFNKDKSAYGSDCTILDPSNRVIDTLILFGTMYPGRSATNLRRWNDAIKVAYDERIIIDDQGRIMKGSNELRNLRLMGNDGTIYQHIAMSKNDPEATAIGQKAVDELLEKEGPFNLLIFRVTTTTGEIIETNIR